MPYVPYAQQLRDPRWQKKRLECLERAGWACEVCGDKTTELHVHHRKYEKGRMAWEYENGDLEVRCRPCHEEHHRCEKLLSGMSADSCGYESQIAALVGGYLYAGMDCSFEDSECARACDEMAYHAGRLARGLYCARADLLEAIQSVWDGRWGVDPGDREALAALIAHAKENH